MSQTFRLTSRSILFFIVVVLVFQFFAVKKWNSEGLWQNEMKAYYAYLPALFVLNDVALEKTEINSYYTEHFFYPQPGKVRGHVIKTTMGVAILQAPFFLIGHAIALNGGDPEDGFCEPYRVLIALSALFYAFWGLFFVRKTLLLFFSDAVTSLVLVTLFIGTNLYFYTLYEGGMTHVYSFFLISVFVHYTVTWHRSPSWGKMLAIGLSMGFITLIRPVNVCLVLFFLLYRDALQASLKQKFIVLFRHWKMLLLAALCFFLVLLPQFLYWQYTSGTWLFYSYGHESFFWLRPKIGLGLFSYQKGWLVWTPVMWFALVGIILLGRRDTRAFLGPVAISLVVYIYIIFCWWCWWYGGGFGMRPMVDVMPVLALPMAAFFQQILRSRLLAVPILGLWIFLVSLNLFQTRQYAWGKLHWAGTTEKIYWQMFLNDYPKEDYSRYLKDPNVEQALRGETGID